MYNYKGSFGACVGDYVGSVYEGYYGVKPTKEEAEIFGYGNTITDDTVMTCAIADCLLNDDADNASYYLKKWARRYPKAGYGGKFYKWAVLGIGKDFNDSYGNGAIMRVSPVAYFARSEKECLELAEKVTIPSHCTEMAVKASKVYSFCLYKLLRGATKEEIMEFVRKIYDVDEVDYNWLRTSSLGIGKIDCETTIKQAFWLYENGKDFEDTLKLGISMGQDNDTLLAITMALAEATYGGVPEWIRKRVVDDIPYAVKSILQKITLKK